MLNPQLDRRGELIHLLTTEGLPRRHVERLLDAAAGFAAGQAPAVAATGLPVFLGLPAGDTDLRQGFEAAAARLGLRPVALADGTGPGGDAGVDRGHGVGAGDPPWGAAGPLEAPAWVPPPRAVHRGGARHSQRQARIVDPRVEIQEAAQQA
ncbi:hypothetical protein O9557_27695, partial [Achromobacter ruhlandii]|nr:hypothetical protein [Achromobacter ruhlandii]